jgi:hypothetical protein
MSFSRGRCRSATGSTTIKTSGLGELPQAKAVGCVGAQPFVTIANPVGVTPTRLLGTITIPADLRRLPEKDLRQVADELRAMYAAAGLDAKGIVAKVFEALGKDARREFTKLR